MSSENSMMRGVTLLSAILQLVVLTVQVGGGYGFQCPEAFYVFGDSLSDTGNAFAALPGNPLLVLNYPYGESYTFRDKPGHNRFCDGRLVIAFIAQYFGFPFFGSYQHALNAADYTRGANFAYAGATARADTTLIPFYLQLQLLEFFYFKNVTLTPNYPDSAPVEKDMDLSRHAHHQRELRERLVARFRSSVGPNIFRKMTMASAHAGIEISLCLNVQTAAQGLYTPEPDSFTNGAYMVPEIGGNDFSISVLVNRLTPSQVIQTIVPQTLAAVVSAVVQLHASGAKLIIVFNIYPQGCNSRTLTLLGNSTGPLDAMGCVDAFNAIDRAYNAQLNQSIIQLRSSFNDGTQVFLFHYYSATIEIMTNPATYGFNPSTILQACCGYGGPYNYNPYVNCGNSGYVPPGSRNFVNINTACANPQAAIYWDGHFTEGFNRQISKFFITGRFVSPQLNLAQTCKLRFAGF